MFKVKFTASINCLAVLSEEDSKKVEMRTKELSQEFGGTPEHFLSRAVLELYKENEIDIYDDCIEIDSTIEKIDYVEEN